MILLRQHTEIYSLLYNADDLYVKSVFFKQRTLERNLFS